MKKALAIICLATFMTASFSACKKSKRDLENYTCEQLEDAMIDAADKYSDNSNLSNCRAYRRSLEDLKTKGCYSYYDESSLNALISTLRIACP